MTDKDLQGGIDALAFWDFAHDLRDWSSETFGSKEFRGPVGALKHLEKEAREAYLETDPEKLREEIADCCFLVLDAAWREGMSFADLVEECQKKLVKNRSRVWTKPTSDEPVEHDRSLD